jgi:hypothetical protein
MLIPGRPFFPPSNQMLIFSVSNCYNFPAEAAEMTAEDEPLNP